VALGSFSPLFLKRYGIKLPVYPVKGYSLTIPIIDSSRAPESTVMDETYKIAITRLGDRIRVGGMAEISGYTNDLGLARRRTLEYSVSDLFPGGDATKGLFWSGLRPMTPDGTPIIGPTRLAGLFLNTGHGTLGWTMSSGSARLIADIVSGRKPEIDVTDLALARYSMDKVGTLRWKAEVAQARMDNLLSANYTQKRVDAVLSPYDGLSIGIISALKGVGYGTADQPMPIISGQDAEVPSVKSIINHEQYSTIFKDTRDLAKVAAGMVDAVVSGGKPEINDTKTYNNKVKIVPSYLLTPVTVDATNWKPALVDTGYYKADQLQ
jgi:hypothetical protein